MTTITIDDEMINELVAVSHFKNAQEAVIKILADYLQQYKKESTASCFDLMQNGLGCIEDAPADLSTNKSYFEGYGDFHGRN
jgi:hypothetical protein